MKQYHITELPTLSEEAISFLAYFMREQLPKVDFNEFIFIEVNAPFGAGTIDYVAYFNADGENNYQVFSLVSSRLSGELNQGLVWRLFDKWELINKAFIQFKLRPISHEGVSELIDNMPVMMIPMKSKGKPRGHAVKS